MNLIIDGIGDPVPLTDPISLKNACVLPTINGEINTGPSPLEITFNCVRPCTKPQLMELVIESDTAPSDIDPKTRSLVNETRQVAAGVFYHAYEEGGGYYTYHITFAKTCEGGPMKGLHIRYADPKFAAIGRADIVKDGVVTDHVCASSFLSYFDVVEDWTAK